MSTAGKAIEPLTLDDFLLQPDEKPYREFVDGRIEVKVSPKHAHSAIQVELATVLDQFARPLRLGRAFVGLRYTFGGRSIVTDVSFQKQENLPKEHESQLSDNIPVAPDFFAEVISAGQTKSRLRNRLRHALAHGCPLAWLIDPRGAWVEVHRPTVAPVRLEAGGILEGEPTLPGFRLAVSDIFEWFDF